VNEPDNGIIVKSAIKTIEIVCSIGADYFYRYKSLPIVLIIGPTSSLGV